jgi:hypothetical protein
MQMLTLINEKDLVIPEETNKESWTNLHSSIILAKKMASKWLRVSRDYGEKNFGIDYVAETEVQMELFLGLEMKDESQSINAQDKSKAIITIEGIHQSFKLWQRKINDDIDNWDKERLGRALSLLEPIEAQAMAIRERLNAE